jgi:hypothetical protein
MFVVNGDNLKNDAYPVDSYSEDVECFLSLLDIFTFKQNSETKIDHLDLIDRLRGWKTGDPPMSDAHMAISAQDCIDVNQFPPFETTLSKHHENGWIITGKVKDRYYLLVETFEATHPVHGKVWRANYDEEYDVYATSESAYREFVRVFPWLQFNSLNQ